MAKTSLIAKLPLKAGTRDRFVAAFAPMLEQVNEEPGTEFYVLHLDDADENLVWVYELYTDADALAAHSSSDAMAAFFGQIGDFIDGAPELIQVTPVAGKGL